MTNYYRKALEASDALQKWENTSVAKKLAIRAKRASLNDFDRFVVNNLKKRRGFELRRKAK